MSKKKIIAIVVSAVLVLAVGGSVVSSVISARRENTDTLTEGLRLVSYELGMYLETENEDYFHQASIDLQSLEQIALENDSILSTDYRKEAFSTIVNAFRYDEEELFGYAERLKSVFYLISENADGDYPYAQLYIITENIT